MKLPQCLQDSEGASPTCASSHFETLQFPAPHRGFHHYKLQALSSGESRPAGECNLGLREKGPQNRKSDRRASLCNAHCAQWAVVRHGLFLDGLLGFGPQNSQNRSAQDQVGGRGNVETCEANPTTAHKALDGTTMQGHEEKTRCVLLLKGTDITTPPSII